MSPYRVRSASAASASSSAALCAPDATSAGARSVGRRRARPTVTRQSFAKERKGIWGSGDRQIRRVALIRRVVLLPHTFTLNITTVISAPWHVSHHHGDLLMRCTRRAATTHFPHSIATPRRSPARRAATTHFLHHGDLPRGRPHTHFPPRGQPSRRACARAPHRRAAPSRPEMAREDTTARDVRISGPLAPAPPDEYRSDEAAAPRRTSNARATTVGVSCSERASASFAARGA